MKSSAVISLLNPIAHGETVQTDRGPVTCTVGMDCRWTVRNDRGQTLAGALPSQAALIAWILHWEREAAE